MTHAHDKAHTVKYYPAGTQRSTERAPRRPCRSGLTASPASSFHVCPMPLSYGKTTLIRRRRVFCPEVSGRSAHERPHR